MNSLARLGWSLDDKSEIMSLNTIIENFSLERITSSPAGLDPDKMFWMQDHYMRQLPAQERIERMLPFLQREGLVSTPATDDDRATVAKIDAASGDRLKLLADIVRYGGMFLRDKLIYDSKSAKTLAKEGAVEQIGKLRAALESVDPFTVESIEAAVHAVAEETGVGGKINHVLRAATTGQSVGPGVYDCVVILGKDKAIRNLDATKAELEAGTLKASEA